MSAGTDPVQIRRLFELGRALVPELDQRAVLSQILEAAREITGARYAALGERAPAVRAAAAGRLGFLGVGVDRAANEEAVGDRDISAAGSAVATVDVAASEGREIARQVNALLGRSVPTSGPSMSQAKARPRRP